VIVEADKLLAEKLNKAWRFLYGRGSIDGFGHITARTSDPNKLLVTPHSLGGDSTPDDFVMVDLEGKQVDSDVKLPAELPIHLAIYRRRPDVGAVAHLHSLYATSFTMNDQELGVSYFLGSVFRSGIPTHPDPRLILDDERSEALAATLGPHRAVLMKAHGIAVAGDDVEEMLSWAFLLEENARRTWVSSTIGKVEFLDDVVMEEIEAEMLASRGPIKRIWALCESEAGVD
jgi:ribulose-5-phosphate 4-epimerase/fuculose-1-phosphate aldolase